MNLIKELSISRAEGKQVSILCEPCSKLFEKAYINVRKKENRILADNEVKNLPKADSSNFNQKEWAIRERSAQKFYDYLECMALEERDWILDIGCGNGWFSNKLAEELKAQVLAIDINIEELEQASRVFSRDNLYFAYMELAKNKLQSELFSLIVLNSSIQYFEKPEALLDNCLDLLKVDGEIHIIDSPFYSKDEVMKAQQRTKQYYQQLKADDMLAYYHHHSDSIFKNYKSTFLYHHDEKKLERLKNDSPFPWVRIQK